MAFCGQCGFQLLPGARFCQRCGAATEPNMPIEELHPNDPTVAILPTLDAFPAQSTQSTQQAQWSTPLPTVPPTPPPINQQNLVLRPDGTGYDATQMTTGPTYQINMTPPPPTSQPGTGASYPSYPGYVPTSGANYPPQSRDASSPGFQTQQAQSSPGLMPPGGAVYQPISDSFGSRQQAPQKRGQGGLIALILLLAILIIGGAAGVFVLKQQGILFNNGTGTGPTPLQTATAIPSPTPSPTPSPAPSPTPSPTTVPLTQQAQTVLQNYYDDINNKNYSASYAMLGSQMQQNQQSYSQYQAGFANTQQDAITIIDSTQQSDGTVKLDVTLQATNTDGSQHTYQGYYIVGPENGSLKILSGQLTQTS